MARPKKKETEKLTRRLPHVRCTDGDYATIQSKAAQAGLSQSEYIRRMARDGQIIIRKSATDFALADQLRRLGVNINQQTRKLHATGEVPEELRRLWMKLETALDHVLNDSSRRP